MSEFSLPQRLYGKLQRLTAIKLNKSPLVIPEGFRAVSLCFDDFPESALYGAEMLEKTGARGTFYTCFSMLEQPSPSGKIAALDQVRDLAVRGHEIACHTYDHLNCSFTATRRIRASCDRNRRMAQDNGLTLRNFAYPQGGISLSSKPYIQKTYHTARTTIPGINRGLCDAHVLRGVPVYEDSAWPVIHEMLEATARDGGWFILYTHDIVRTLPSPYGISMSKFDTLVADIVKRGLALRTVSDVAEELLNRQS